MSQLMTIRKAIRKGADYLSRHGVSSARLDAELLLASLLAQERLKLYLNLDKPLTESEKSKYRDLLLRRAKREPVAYITGKKEFWSLEFKVDRSVMIPRPETEILVERAVEKALLLAEQSEGELTILDLGTGSGAVAISLAAELQRHFSSPGAPRLRIIASDISERALEVARFNASNLVPEAPIEFRLGSFFEGISERIPLGSDALDLVVSNPPYVALSEKDSLAPEISLWEPPEAIFAGEDAFRAIRAISSQAHEYLRAGGFLLMEIGIGQENGAKEILLSSGAFCNIEFFKDYGGVARVVSLQRNPNPMSSGRE